MLQSMYARMTSLAAVMLLCSAGCIQDPAELTADPPPDAGTAGDADIDGDAHAALDADADTGGISCEIEDPEAVCASAGAECGEVTAVDPCMDPTEIDCGTCGEETFCQDNTCVAGRRADSLLALYTFTEQSGTTVHDQGPGSPTVDLEFSSPDDDSAIGWVEDCECVVFTGGKLIAEELDALYDRLADDPPHEFTMETWIATHDLWADGPARIVAMTGGTGAHNFMFGQSNLGIQTRLHRIDQHDEYRLETHELLSTTLHQFVFTLGEQGAKLYRDGVLVDHREDAPAQPLEDWDRDMPLILGNEHDHVRAWYGTMHLTALYDRVLEDDEISRHFALGPHVP